MKETIEDKRLKEIFKRDLPAAPENPWFVRKVMNRLPARTSNVASIIEYAGFIVAGVILAFYWYMLVTDAESSDVITVKDIIYYCILTAMTFSLAIGFLFSQLRRN